MEFRNSFAYVPGISDLDVGTLGSLPWIVCLKYSLRGIDFLDIISDCPRSMALGVRKCFDSELGSQLRVDDEHVIEEGRAIMSPGDRKW